MSKTYTADVIIDHGKLTFTSDAYQATLDLAKISAVTVDEEAAVTAAERELDVDKLLSWEPDLAKLLRIKLVVQDMPFMFTVAKKQAKPVLAHFASKLPNEIFSSRHRANTVRIIDHYPFHIHSCGEGLFAI